VHDQRLLKMPATATVREAAQKMARRDVRSVLVTKGSKLEGIFTGTDLIARVVAPGLDPDATPLGQVMTRNPRTVSPAETAIEALRCMDSCHCRHLPVVEGGKLIGILSRRDFLGYEIDEIERQERIAEEL
ncbi:MAG TPA: CBS domain-containing protein, partial [Alphaproteobacteria bacterium]